jgi:hypothetical protein
VEPQAVVNARILYGSCLNETGIEADGVAAILSLIDSKFGGWPILKGLSCDGSTFDLSNLLLTLRKYSNHVIYRVGTATDEKNSIEYDIEVKKNESIYIEIYL